MNKEVLLMGDRIIVKTSDGESKEFMPLDNLVEILMEENIIEAMENIIKNIEYSSNNFKKSKFKDLFSIPIPILSSLGTPLLFLIFNEFPNVIDTKFGLMEKEKFIAIFGLIFLPFGYSMSKKWYQEYKEEVNSENGRQVVLMQIKKNLDIQNTKLDLLRSKSKVVDISSFQLGTVKADEALETIQSHIDMYYEIGYNLKYYYTYFMLNGELPMELKEEYNETGQEIIKDFLVKNGPKVKKIGSKKNK